MLLYLIPGCLPDWRAQRFAFRYGPQSNSLLVGGRTRALLPVLATTNSPRSAPSISAPYPVSVCWVRYLRQAPERTLHTRRQSQAAHIPVGNLVGHLLYRNSGCRLAKRLKGELAGRIPAHHLGDQRLRHIGAA
jgi:hypothetical protein